ncbi:hypothetical protein [Amycolatopsis sp. lyj-346]|uniref:hypothetical protein n=1 Tax=Amycolatopsis sp. lyj-346 TaxID=2789289 RepID=UPI003978C875
MIATAGLVAPAPGTAGAATRNPVIPGYYADPCVMHFGDRQDGGPYLHFGNGTCFVVRLGPFTKAAGNPVLKRNPSARILATGSRCVFQWPGTTSGTSLPPVPGITCEA